MPEDEGMYEYQTPDGYGDIFFVYVYDGAAGGLMDGKDYSLLGIPVTDGAFCCRAWNGAYAVLSQTAGALGKIQIYDSNLAAWFDNPTSCYTPNPTRQCACIVPEKVYVVDGAIRFDLLNVELKFAL